MFHDAACNRQPLSVILPKGEYDYYLLLLLLLLLLDKNAADIKVGNRRKLLSDRPTLRQQPPTDADNARAISTVKRKGFTTTGAQKPWARNAKSDLHAGSACPGRDQMQVLNANIRCSTTAGVRWKHTYTPPETTHAASPTTNRQRTMRACDPPMLGAHPNLNRCDAPRGQSSLNRCTAPHLLADQLRLAWILCGGGGVCGVCWCVCLCGGNLAWCVVCGVCVCVRVVCVP